MLKVRYVAASADVSGYGFASRNYIYSLLGNNEIDLSVKLASFEREKTTHGKGFDEKILPLVNKPLKADIQIIHLTPENYSIYRDPNAYNIAYCVWETDILPYGWKEALHTVDEIWTASDWNVSVFKKNGISKSIKKIPHAFSPFPEKETPALRIGAREGSFKFYSIFQWIERKHPLGLLKAYLTEFTNQDNVALILKAYRLNTGVDEQEKIKRDINTIKSALNLKTYPPIYFFGGLMPAEQIASLHQSANCYVSPSRGEAFGQTYAEAMLAGNPVIGTGYSGNLEFMNKDNSYLIDYQLTPCCGMIFPNYNGRMTWAEPNINHLKELMRYVFEHQEEAAQIGLKGQVTIAKDFNFKKIGELMVNRLKQIKGV